MARKTKEETEHTYNMLLDAAARLFIEQGVARTTLNDIASSAGMTRGAVYWHFDNKDAVIRALWDRNADSLHETFREELSLIDDADPAEHFREILQRLIQRVVDEPELGQVMRIVMHNVELTEKQTELQKFLIKKREGFYTAMQDAFSTLKSRGYLASDLPPALLAHGLMSYLHGLIHNHMDSSTPEFDLKHDGELLINLYLDSVLLPVWMQ